MKKLIFCTLMILMWTINGLQAQKYFTREGKIVFFSDAVLEKIEAVNSNVTSVMDIESSKLEFAVLIKAFQFEKALMQEHFNENYMESSKFPKALFKGKIDNPDEVDFQKDGKYEVTVSGDITIHGVTKKLTATGTFEVKGESIIAHAVFPFTVADFDIIIPGVVRDNIAKEVEVTLDAEYKLFKR